MFVFITMFRSFNIELIQPKFHPAWHSFRSLRTPDRLSLKNVWKISQFALHQHLVLKRRCGETDFINFPCGHCYCPVYFHLLCYSFDLPFVILCRPRRWLRSEELQWKYVMEIYCGDDIGRDGAITYVHNTNFILLMRTPSGRLDLGLEVWELSVATVMSCGMKVYLGGN